MPVEDADFQAGLDALVGRLNAAGAQVAVKAGAVVQREGMTKTKVVTGTLRRSWRTERAESGNGVFAVRVAPTMIYGRRQELGFLPPLKDSLGRSFPHDRGRPYVRPTLDESVPKVRLLAVRSYAAAVSG